MSDRPRGVMLVGHGTRDKAGTAQFFALGELLSERLKPMAVQTALLEFQSPTIPEAWESLVQQGVGHVHIAPLLLFAAGHAKQDIPQALSKCQLAHPDISFDQCRPLSRHPSIIDLAVQRAREAIKSVATPMQRCAVVMVGRGNRDPCAQADMRVLTEVLSRRIEAAKVVTAFYAMAEPSLIDVLQAVAAGGDIDSILVQPHLLFEGRLYRSIISQMEEVSRRYPDVQFVHSRYLGPDPRVADAIAARIGQLDPGV